MVVMLTIFAAVVIAVVVVLLVAWGVRRRGTDEVHSVEGYRHTLDTLSSMRTGRPGGSVRVVGGPTTDRLSDPDPAASRGPGLQGPADSAPSRKAGPGRVGWGPTARGDLGGDPGGPPLVFEDESLRHGGISTRPEALSARGQTRAMSAMNHRPRRLGPVIVAVVVVLAIVALAVYGARSHHPAKSASGTAQVAAGSTSHSSTTARSSGRHKKGTAAGRSGGKVKSGGKGHTAPTTPTTAVPPRFLPDTATATATTATYAPPAGTYTLTLATTTGDCWLTVTTNGASVFSQTLPPGQRKSLTLSGATTILIGAPTYLAVTLDHEPVVLPAGFQTPFTMTLQPATSTG